MDWIYVTEDGERWRTLVNTIMAHRIGFYNTVVLHAVGKVTTAVIIPITCSVARFRDYEILCMGEI